jgi:hypothetical protein
MADKHSATVAALTIDEVRNWAIHKSREADGLRDELNAERAHTTQLIAAVQAAWVDADQLAEALRGVSPLLTGMRRHPALADHDREVQRRP